MIEPGKVDVKEIQCDRQRSEFDENKIDELASNILETGILVKPLLLKQETFDSYTLLDGYLEYYAAVRARERDPRRAEMIDAIVVPIKFDGNLDAVLNQVRVLEVSHSNVPDENTLPQTTPSKKSEATPQETLSHWITSFENRLSSMQGQLHDHTLNVDRRLNSLEKSEKDEKSQITLLTAFNTYDEKEITKLFDLVKGRNSKASKTLAQTLISVREQLEEDFFSYKEIVGSVKGLTANTMISLMEKGSWAERL